MVGYFVVIMRFHENPEIGEFGEAMGTMLAFVAPDTFLFAFIGFILGTIIGICCKSKPPQQKEESK